MGATKFGLSHDIFYKMLFSFRKADAADANLLFFLADFGDKDKKQLKFDLNKVFSMGQGGSGARVLEDSFNSGKLDLDDDEHLWN